MRENPFKIALFLLSAALLPSVASARPARPAHKRPGDAAATQHASQHASQHTSHAANRPSPHALASTRVSPHPRSKTPSQANLRAEAKGSKQLSEHHAASLHVAHWVSGHHASDRPEIPRRGRQTRIPQAHPADTQAPHTRLNDKLRHAPVEDARMEPAAEAPASIPTAAALPPIEVHHNRKVHLLPDAAAAPAAPAADSAPRKATTEDFLPGPAAPAADDDSEAPAGVPATISPAAKYPARPASPLHPASLPTPSVVERKLPLVRPVPELVPDPITEPVLYTPRGRLIVPPAMKGSRDILLHQNEMADHDGLERIQNDVHLDRLRGSRQLVPLPVSAALEIDDRLPENRRFCRPWTAQFLALLARAHYARFHTPLQVNSAVRTVEFQERLRYTNGNAAPAEGETASPHLTGQAVDLAKHGLSMTEIAWLRGYLMPLVQQGKVDVEEEFQQSCFHISVYKKYIPQAVPKRDIPQHRGPATALAAAIQ